MSEELTLEGVAEIADIDFNQLEDIARAHLSRPVLEDEQMREALETAKTSRPIAEHLAEHSPNADDKSVFRDLAEVSRALLAMSEQLSAEQEKVKALQPYKDAYEAGQDMFAESNGCGRWNDAHKDGRMVGYEVDKGNEWTGRNELFVERVRVCKLVEGDG